MTPSPETGLGLETTADSRAAARDYFVKDGAPDDVFELCLLRDIDRLLAALSASREQSRLPAPEEVEPSTSARALRRLAGRTFDDPLETTAEEREEARTSGRRLQLRSWTDKLFADFDRLLRRLAAPATGAGDETAFLVQAIQTIREQFSPLEDGEAVMLDTLQDRVERRDTIKPDGSPATGAGAWRPLHEMLRDGDAFVTITTGDGRPYVKIDFSDLTTARRFHDVLIGLRGTAPPSIPDTEGKP